MQQCGLKRTKLVTYKGRKAAIASLRYTGRNQAGRIFRLFYDEASIYLPRKRSGVSAHLAEGLEFTPNLKALRQARSLTQRQLSAASGVMQAQLSGLELGKRRAVFGTREKIAAALGVDSKDLLSFH